MRADLVHKGCAFSTFRNILQNEIRNRLTVLIFSNKPKRISRTDLCVVYLVGGYSSCDKVIYGIEIPYAEVRLFTRKLFDYPLKRVSGRCLSGSETWRKTKPRPRSFFRRFLFYFYSFVFASCKAFAYVFISGGVLRCVVSILFSIGLSSTPSFSALIRIGSIFLIRCWAANCWDFVTLTIYLSIRNTVAV